MSGPTLIVITGSPATGKSTLARELSERLRVPWLGKDMIKEPLLDALGAGDRAHSRRLSDASFAVLFAVARAMSGQRVTLILEGNFRPGEHEPLLAPLLAAGVSLIQIECRVEESIRSRRLRQRENHPRRHPGHRDTDLLAAGLRAAPGFLDLPGRRIEFDSGAAQPDYRHLESELHLMAGSGEPAL